MRCFFCSHGRSVGISLLSWGEVEVKVSMHSHLRISSVMEGMRDRGV